MSSIESPFFANVEVDRALADPSSLNGLTELLKECYIEETDCRLEYHKQRILRKIERCEWFLVKDRPFLPLTYAELERCSKISLSFFAQSSGRSIALRVLVAGGPGRWVKKSIEYDVAKNAVFFTLNWLSSRGEEGRPFLTEGKDYANTFRTVIQEWQPLKDGQEHLKDKSVSRYYGELRRIRQQYVEADDHWQISGSSWHWRPVTTDIAYELKGK